MSGGRRAGVSLLIRVLLIVAATGWIYYPSIHGDWLWDDDLYVTENSWLRSLAGLGHLWTQPSRTHEYYPLLTTVQWVQWHLWGDDTFGYHLANVGLHIVAALLVWRLLNKFGLGLAWLGGFLFAFHPVMVESVAWISELKNVLSLPPFLLAMIFWLDYEEKRQRRDYLLSLAFFLVAMLVKTSMSAFPVMILIYAWWKRGRMGWSDLKASAPFFAMSLLIGLLAVWISRDSSATVGAVPQGNFAFHLAPAGGALSILFATFFLPVDLMTIYPRWPVDSPTLTQLLPWVVLVGVLAFLWGCRKSWGRHALLGLGYFLIMLTPVLALVATDAGKLTWSLDHLAYLPSIGLIGLTVAALEQLRARVPGAVSLIGGLIIGFVMVALTLESHAYAGRYRDPQALWTAAVQCNPRSWTAQCNLGKDLSERGRVAEAIAHFRLALALKPDFAYAHVYLGDSLMHSGHLAEGMQECRTALSIFPNFDAAHNSLGYGLMQSGHLPEAIEQFKLALKISPNNAVAHDHLGSTLMQTGDMAGGFAECQEAIKINPNLASAHSNLGYAWLQANHLEEAGDEFALTVKLDPHLADGHNNWGYVLMQKGHPDEAIEQFRQAVQINPGYAEAHMNWGTALAKSGRWAEAAEQLELTLNLQSDNADAKTMLGQIQARQKAAAGK